jgi:6-phosphogluconolactonase
LRSTSALASFSIDKHSGKLKLLSSARLPKGEDAVYVGTLGMGRWLVSVSYAACNVVIHRINEDGTIQMPPVQTLATAKTAHCAVTDHSGRIVFVPHVAPNAIFQFRLDEQSGRLTEAGKVPGGTANAGPRHLVFHPNLNVAYTSNESGSSISVYRFDPEAVAFDDTPGGLQPAFQTLSTLPSDFQGRNTAAEVKIHPNGNFVFVSNRGHDSLAAFAIGAEGKLTALGQTPTEKTPRSFDFTEDGRFLLVPGEASGKLTVYRVDPGSGKLSRLETYDVGKGLTWVLTVADAREQIKHLMERLGASGMLGLSKESPALPPLRNVEALKQEPPQHSSWIKSSQPFGMALFGLGLCAVAWRVGSWMLKQNAERASPETGRGLGEFMAGLFFFTLGCLACAWLGWTYFPAWLENQLWEDVPLRRPLLAVLLASSVSLFCLLGVIVMYDSDNWKVGRALEYAAGVPAVACLALYGMTFVAYWVHDGISPFRWMTHAQGKLLRMEFLLCGLLAVFTCISIVVAVIVTGKVLVKLCSWFARLP